jgi:hypothetical protein
MLYSENGTRILHLGSIIGYLQAGRCVVCEQDERPVIVYKDRFGFFFLKLEALVVDRILVVSVIFRQLGAHLIKLRCWRRKFSTRSGWTRKVLLLR